MNVSDIRLQKRTNDILKSYLQMGIIPDEFVVEQALQQQLGQYYDRTTGTYTIDVPQWTASNIAYRQTSDFKKWNGTQTMAAEDMEVLYEDFIEQVYILTGKLYRYTTQSNLLSVQLNKLTARLQNLLLTSTATDGYIFSFFDNFIDTSKVSFIDPYITTANVNIDNQTVTITPSGALDLNNKLQSNVSTLNLTFLQQSDVSFYVDNQVTSAGITPLTSQSLVSIFQPYATAWTQSIVTNDPTPTALSSTLTVRISPLDPVTINSVTVNTSMPDSLGQVTISAQYSADGVSWFDVPSASSSQIVIGSATFNFSPIQAAWFRFHIIKNQPDEGATYVIGFQYISFSQITYLTGSDLFSIPITLPNNGPINRVAIDACSVIPPNTAINYSIVVSGIANEIPLSSISDPNPQFPTSANISSTIGISATLETNYIGSGIPSAKFWTYNPVGYIPPGGSIVFPENTYQTNISTFGTGYNPPADIADPTIPQTISIYRDLGNYVNGLGLQQPSSGAVGWQVNPPGLPGYFQTFMQINNPLGTTLDVGTSQVILDNTTATGVLSLTQGIHKIAVTDLDKLQGVVASGCDQFFAYNMKYTPLFNFQNNVSNNDLGYFTYDPTSGDIYINAVSATSQEIAVDPTISFFAATDGTYQSNPVPLNTIVASGEIVTGGTSGSYIDVQLDETHNYGKWVNEIYIDGIIFPVPASVEILSTENNVLQISSGSAIWTSQIPSTNVPYISTGVVVSFKFPQPIFTRSIRIFIDIGTGITLTPTGSVNAYAPLFITPNTVKSVMAYLPTDNQWQGLLASSNPDFTYNDAPSGAFSSTNQTIELFNGFNGSVIGTYNLRSGYTRSQCNDLSGVIIPKFTMTVNSNQNNIDPFISQFNLVSIPVQNIYRAIPPPPPYGNAPYENTLINFEYVAGNPSTITFHANLTSQYPGVTPELKNYRVKML